MLIIYVLYHIDLAELGRTRSPGRSGRRAGPGGQGARQEHSAEQYYLPTLRAAV